MDISWGCGWFLATLFVVINLIGQLGGVVMVMLKLKAEIACGVLFFIVVLQVNSFEFKIILWQVFFWNWSSHNIKCEFSAELRLTILFLTVHPLTIVLWQKIWNIFCWKCAFYVMTWPASKNLSNQGNVVMVMLKLKAEVACGVLFFIVVLQVNS